MQKDTVEKRLEDHEDVFADVFHVLLFQGETVLQPENLEAVPTEAYHQDEEGQWRQRWRDVVKKDVERIHDEQRLAPVITLVLSFDTEGWERPRSVVDMLEIPGKSAEALDMMGAITSDKRYREIKEQVLGKKKSASWPNAASSWSMRCGKRWRRRARNVGCRRFW